MQTNSAVTKRQAAALERAIEARHKSQAEFQRALSAFTGKPVTSSHIHNWRTRDGGAPAAFCPAIEHLTGVRCEELCEEVNWAVLRLKPALRQRKAVAAAG